MEATCTRAVYLFTYLLTYSMVQSPSWEANWSAASQETPRISRNPKVHYLTHKRPPPVSILGQPNPVHIPTSHFLEIHPNIIHPSTPRSPQWSHSLRFPHQDPVHPLSSPIRATCSAHLILLDFITRTILGEEYKSFSSSLCNLLHSPVIPSLLGPNIFLNTLFSNTLSFLSSRSVNDQVSHPYKTTGKITVLYILICQHYKQIYCLHLHSAWFYSDCSQSGCKMEATCSSKNLTCLYKDTLCHNPKDNIRQVCS